MLRTSITALFGEARSEIRSFIRQELDLAKAEVSEKADRYRQAVTNAGIGLTIAYAALLVLFAGLGLLLSFVLQSIGLDLIPARSAGFGAVGLLVIIAGVLALLKGLKSMARTGVAPTKTAYTIHRVAAPLGYHNDVTTPGPPKHASKDLEIQVLATEQRLGRTLEALAARVSPGRLLRKASIKVQDHPLRCNLAALATGFAGSVWFVKKLRK